MDQLLIALLCGSLYTGTPQTACSQGAKAASIQSGFHQNSNQIETRVEAGLERVVKPYEVPELYPVAIAGVAYASRNDLIKASIDRTPDHSQQFMFGAGSKSFYRSGPKDSLSPFTIADSLSLQSDFRTTTVVLIWNF